jgi:uncharacterized protein YndB with AHSA1/START domain
MGFRWTIQIDAPPEAVFDTVSDMARHGEWANEKAKLRVHEVSGGPAALGSTYRSEAMFLGKPAHADLEIVAFDRPRRFTYSVTHQQDGKKDVHLTHTFVLTPNGGGSTKLERITDGDGSPILGALFYPAIKADGRVQLRNLKARVESAVR